MFSIGVSTKSVASLENISEADANTIHTNIVHIIDNIALKLIEDVLSK